MPQWKHGSKGSPIVKYFWWIVSALLVTGCEETFPVYAAFEKQDMQRFACLDYMVVDDALRSRIVSALQKPHDSGCEYKLQFIEYHVGKCDNPVVKSMGSDFDGYVRIEVRKGFDIYYKVQSDFKNDPEAALKRILERAAKDIGKDRSTA